MAPEVASMTPDAAVRELQWILTESAWRREVNQDTVLALLDRLLSWHHEFSARPAQRPAPSREALERLLEKRA